jgi:hypothetical protein
VAALNKPGVENEFRRFRRLSWGTLLVGLGLFVGFVISASHVETRADSLQANGVKVPGVVLSSAGRKVIAGFDWRGPRKGVVHLDERSPQYDVGEAVDVYVDPHDASHFSINSETNQHPATVWLMIIALVASIVFMPVGLWMVVRTMRQSHILKRNEWRSFSARYVAAPSRSATQLLFLESPGTSGYVVHLLANRFLLTARRAGFLNTPRAPGVVKEFSGIPVAGKLSRYVVVQSPNGFLFSGSPSKADWIDRRWRSFFSPGST